MLHALRSIGRESLGLQLLRVSSPPVKVRDMPDAVPANQTHPAGKKLGMCFAFCADEIAGLNPVGDFGKGIRFVGVGVRIASSQINGQ